MRFYNEWVVDFDIVEDDIDEYSKDGLYESIEEFDDGLAVAANALAREYGKTRRRNPETTQEKFMSALETAINGHYFLMSFRVKESESREVRVAAILQRGIRGEGTGLVVKVARTIYYLEADPYADGVWDWTEGFGTQTYYPVGAVAEYMRRNGMFHEERAC